MLIAFRRDATTSAAIPKQSNSNRDIARQRLRLATLVLAFDFLAAPITAVAQEWRVYRIGILTENSPSPPGTVVQTLRELGYVEGQNIVIDRRWAEWDPERLPRLAAELVALKPDVILVTTTPGTLAVKRATATIPIVMLNVTDPVDTGLVASLTRPGGNVTGVADLGVQTAVKALDLIRATVPRASRIAVLMSDNPAHVFQLKGLQAAAQGVHFTLLPIFVKSFDDYDAAFVSITGKRADAVIVLADIRFGSPRNAGRLAELAAQARLPMLSQDRQTVVLGALMSYTPTRVGRFAAHYIDKILKGAKPADMPVQQPTEFLLVINVKTAKLLGLTLPNSVLVGANEIIK